MMHYDINRLKIFTDFRNSKNVHANIIKTMLQSSQSKKFSTL